MALMMTSAIEVNAFVMFIFVMSKLYRKCYVRHCIGRVLPLYITVVTYCGVHMPPRSTSSIEADSCGVYVNSSGSVYLSGYVFD